MQLRPCGNSDLSLSVLGLGCWMFGGADGDYWGAHDRKAADDLVAFALDHGVNYFDTAIMYNDGRSEEALGRALRGRRDRAIIGSKIIPEKCEPAEIRRTVEASLRRLATDTIDIYMIHWPIRQFSLPDALHTLDDLRRQGKIRHIGVSNFGVLDLADALAAGVPVVSDQMFYNLLSRAIESRIVPFLREKNIGLMTYLPLMQGLLSGRYGSLDEVPPIRLRMRHFRPDRHPASRHNTPGAEDEVLNTLRRIQTIADQLGVSMPELAIAWQAHRPAVTCIVAGARDRDQLARNIKGAQLVLAPETIEDLDRATLPLFDLLGDDPDYWSPPGQSRIR